MSLALGYQYGYDILKLCFGRCDSIYRYHTFQEQSYVVKDGNPPRKIEVFDVETRIYSKALVSK